VQYQFIAFFLVFLTSVFGTLFKHSLHNFYKKKLYFKGLKL